MAEITPIRGRKCPVCGKKAVADYVPFCSKRCADIDLHRWFGETYRIPAEEPAETDDGPPENDDA